MTRGLAKAGFNPQQPREHTGRWTGNGGGVRLGAGAGPPQALDPNQDPMVAAQMAGQIADQRREARRSADWERVVAALKIIEAAEQASARGNHYKPGTWQARFRDAAQKIVDELELDHELQSGGEPGDDSQPGGGATADAAKSLTKQGAKMTENLAAIQSNASHFVMAMLGRELAKKLGAGATASDYIHDFVHSTNPRFKGKSKKERIRMALGAFYARKMLKAYNPNQPRHPAGSPAGGEWAPSSGGGGGRAFSVGGGIGPKVALAVAAGAAVAAGGPGAPGRYLSAQIRAKDVEIKELQQHRDALIRGGSDNSDPDLIDVNSDIAAAREEGEKLLERQAAHEKQERARERPFAERQGVVYGSEASEAAQHHAEQQRTQREKQVAEARQFATQAERIAAADKLIQASEPKKPQQPSQSSYFSDPSRVVPAPSRPEAPGVRQTAYDAASAAVGATNATMRTVRRVAESANAINNISIGVRGVLGAADLIEVGQHLHNLQGDIRNLHGAISALPAEARAVRNTVMNTLRGTQRTLETASDRIGTKSGKIALGSAAAGLGLAINEMGLGKPQQKYAEWYRQFSAARRNWLKAENAA